jgi:hypothetical protein
MKKNGKRVHGVMICDVVPRKNTKHGILTFQRKTLHKNWQQVGPHLAFYPIELDLCKFYTKFLNIDTIFGGYVHLSMDYNFHN